MAQNATSLITKRGLQSLLNSSFLVGIADEISNIKFIEDFDKIVSYIKTNIRQG